MEDHAGVAQQGIQSLPVGRHRHRWCERIGQEESDGREERSDKAKKDGSPRDQGTGPLCGAHDDHSGKESLEKRPQEQRSLLPSPYRRNLQINRQTTAGVLSHVPDTKLVVQERGQEGEKGQTKKSHGGVDTIAPAFGPAKVGPADAQKGSAGRVEGCCQRQTDEDGAYVCQHTQPPPVWSGTSSS